MIIVLFLVFSLYIQTTFSVQHHYGTKTPYNPGNLQLVPPPAGCKAVHLNMLLRHASRYPSSGNRERMAEILKKINQAHTTNFTYRNLTLPWSQPAAAYKLAQGKELSVTGEREAYLLGKRFRGRFPTLFNRKYWTRLYEFISTDKLRTTRTAAAFGYGLFEGNGTLGHAKYQPIAIKFSGPKDNDKVLRYYDSCPKYKKEIEDGSGLDQVKEFGAGPEMESVISNIEDRLQIKGKVKLTVDDAKELLMLCAFATLNNEKRDWCSVFNEKDIEVFEYLFDLDNYYSHSYGNQISYETSCPLLADIINTLNEFVNNSVPYGIFRFAHSGTMVALQSILGLFKDPIQLKANNFAENTNRTFRMSSNVPMAANVAIVLYRCGKSFKVQVLTNERPAELPCCKGESVCSLKTFMACFQDIADKCDFDAMCKLSSPTGLGISLHTQGYWNMLVALLFVRVSQAILLN